MFSIKKEIIVPFSSHQMYNLVNDVKSYPDFLIWCEKVDILEKTEKLQKATLYLKNFPVSLTTENKMIENTSINIQMLKGPFKNLKSNWFFKELDLNSCKINFSIEFDYSNFLLEKTLGPIFNIASIEMVSCFYQRAKKIYSTIDKIRS